MRRTDRLFEIIQIVRDGRLHLARDIAERLEVSVRTVYRDIDTLIASGIPIEGERGVGYLLREQIFLPPLTLTLAELEALQLGMAIVGKAADEELRVASQSLLAKVGQVTPNKPNLPTEWSFGVYPTEQTILGFKHMPTIRTAIRAMNKLKVRYLSLKGDQTERIIWPLQIEYWGQVWTLASWCELRGTFRAFRIDQIVECHETNNTFQHREGTTLADYFETYESDLKNEN